MEMTPMVIAVHEEDLGGKNELKSAAKAKFTVMFMAAGEACCRG